MNQFNEKNQRHGYWEIYYLNGKLAAKGTYINHKRHGYWEEFLVNGQLYWKGYFDNDKRIGYLEWHHPIINEDNRIEKEFYL